MRLFESVSDLFRMRPTVCPVQFKTLLQLTRCSRGQTNASGNCTVISTQSGAKKAQEWSELAVMPDDDYVKEEDPAFQEDINRLCTHGLKAMLKEDGRVRNHCCCRE